MLLSRRIDNAPLPPFYEGQSNQIPGRGDADKNICLVGFHPLPKRFVLWGFTRSAFRGPDALPRVFRVSDRPALAPLFFLRRLYFSILFELSTF